MKNDRERNGETCRERDTGTNDRESVVAREIQGHMTGIERERVVAREIQG